MSWANGRCRNICKRITFTPEEWEAASKLHALAAELAQYRPFSRFARAMLTQGEVTVIVKRPLTDPEPIAAAIDRIGVNINQIAHWANQNQSISSEQVAAVRDGFAHIEATLNRIFDAQDAALEEQG